MMAGLFTYGVGQGLKKGEISSCEKLENQSKEYEFFFVTQWQKDMCDSRGFTFAGSKNAPVHVDTMPNGGDGYLEAGVWYTNGMGKWKLETSESGFTE